MTTYAITSKIVFPEHNGRTALTLRKFNGCTVNQSWMSLTDTAEIILPRKKYNTAKVKDVLPEGSPVEIYMGYNELEHLEFRGYIREYNLDVPFTIQCDDEMYMLKRKRVNLSAQNSNLQAILQEIAGEYEIRCDNTSLVGDLRYVDTAVSKILEDLQDKGIYCWFEGKVLHAFSASKHNLEPVRIDYEKCAASNLSNKVVEDLLVTIKLTLSKGKPHIVEYGEKNASVKIKRELAGVNITAEEMQQQAKQIYEQAKTPGLTGDITLFADKRFVHGMRMDLHSVLDPSKNGVYYVDAIQKKLTPTEGLKQVCTLGNKA